MSNTVYDVLKLYDSRLSKSTIVEQRQSPREYNVGGCIVAACTLKDRGWWGTEVRNFISVDKGKGYARDFILSLINNSSRPLIFVVRKDNAAMNNLLCSKFNNVAQRSTLSSKHFIYIIPSINKK